MLWILLGAALAGTDSELGTAKQNEKYILELAPPSFKNLDDYPGKVERTTGGTVIKGNQKKRLMLWKSDKPFVKLENAEFTKSMAQLPGVKGYGGAMYIEHGEICSIDSLFETCWARAAGALAIFDCSSHIQNTSFTKCQSDIQGGALLVAGCNVFNQDAHEDWNNVYNFITIFKCTFEGCRSGVAGAIVLISIAESFIMQTTISQCVASRNCGALRVHDSNLVAEGNMFSRNILSREALRVDFAEPPNLTDGTNNIWVTLNSPDKYSDVVMRDNVFEKDNEDGESDLDIVVDNSSCSTMNVRVISVNDRFCDSGTKEQIDWRKSVKCPIGVCQFNGSVLKEPTDSFYNRETSPYSHNASFESISEMSVPKNTPPSWISITTTATVLQVDTLWFVTPLTTVHTRRTFVSTSQFTDSCVFSASTQFTGSSVFTHTEQFTQSKSFSVSAEFTGSTKFTVSSALAASTYFTVSSAFSASSKFTGSSAFTGSNQFTGSSAFAGSKQFLQSSALSASSKFTGSSAFTGSKQFTQSSALSASAEFTKSSTFTPSSVFSGSSPFTPTLHLTNSGVFTASGAFASSATFPVPTKTPTATESQSPPPLLINLGDTERDSTQTDLIVGITTGAVVIIIAVVTVIAVVKKRRVLDVEISSSSKEMDASGETWMHVHEEDCTISTIRNQAQVMSEIWDDGGNFDNDFTMDRNTTYNVHGRLDGEYF